MSIHVATSDEEIAACFPVMSQLRPHLKVEEFVPIVRSQMSEGYRLAYLQVSGRPVAVAGYRIRRMLALGIHLYVDDLVTDEAARSQGHGSKLLAWLRAQARTEGCGSVHLDTAVHRIGAQRFYEREGMKMSGYHYAIVS